MITLHDLDTAIAKCQGLSDPKPADAIKLAAFYIIKNEMFGQTDSNAEQHYSYAYQPGEPTETLISYQSGTEFTDAIDGRKASDIWPTIDELMEVLKVTTPRLYKGVMRKINN